MFLIPFVPLLPTGTSSVRVSVLGFTNPPRGSEQLAQLRSGDQIPSLAPQGETRHPEPRQTDDPQTLSVSPPSPPPGMAWAWHLSFPVSLPCPEPAIPAAGGPEPWASSTTPKPGRCVAEEQRAMPPTGGLLPRSGLARPGDFST